MIMMTSVQIEKPQQQGQTSQVLLWTLAEKWSP